VAKVLSGEIWEIHVPLKRSDYMTNPTTHISFLSAFLLYSLLSQDEVWQICIITTTMMMGSKKN
jgi:hypothetical protein